MFYKNLISRFPGRFTSYEVQLWKKFSIHTTFIDFHEVSLLTNWNYERRFHVIKKFIISIRFLDFHDFFLQTRYNYERRCFHFTRFILNSRIFSFSLKLRNTFSSHKMFYKYPISRFPGRFAPDKVQLWKKFSFHTKFIDFHEDSLLTGWNCARHFHLMKCSINNQFLDSHVDSLQTRCNYERRFHFIQRLLIFPCIFSSHSLQFWKTFSHLRRFMNFWFLNLCEVYLVTNSNCERCFHFKMFMDFMCIIIF